MQGRATPDESGAARLPDGTPLEGDAVVWACGGWLGGLFGELAALRVTCQELVFLDGGPAWAQPGLPGWVDYDRAMYGTARPRRARRQGRPSTPRAAPLGPDDELPAGRPPPRRGAARVCRRALPRAGRRPAQRGIRTLPATSLLDSNFIAAEHPGRPGTWLLGGGSGHGFKHGPAMAERVAALRGEQALPARFGVGARAAGRLLRTAGSGA